MKTRNADKYLKVKVHQISSKIEDATVSITVFDIPHSQEPQEGVREGFSVEVHVDVISCRISTPQIFHMWAHPKQLASLDNWSTNGGL